MIYPHALQQGDTVAIVATARKNILPNLQPAIDLLNSWGLEVLIGQTIGLDNHQLAGTDEQRAADLQMQLENPKVKAIWCVRGGYGTVRMIDLVDFSVLAKQPKWIIGFSDVTVLHAQLHQLGFASIHGLMPVNVEKASAEALESLRKCLFNEPLHYELPYQSENQLGKASGELIGGNLSILYSLMGSTSQLDAKGKVLFIEDLDEYLYHLDRMCMGLKRSGLFSQLNGVVVGTFSQMHDNEIPWGKSAYEILAEHLSPLNIPIAFHFPAGHIADNRALPFGKMAHLQVSVSGTTLAID
ncbi:MAG: LD-carboxypeptidase [Flavobacterium sp.]|nr:LD-carboxypeptidase [Flavobacterium sp.]